LHNITFDYKILGPIGTNCYLLCNEYQAEDGTTQKQCVLVDPADDIAQIEELISRNHATLVAVLLTHGHYDHIMAAKSVRNEYHVPIYASCDEETLLASPDMNLSALHGFEVMLEADVLHNDGDVLHLAGMDIEVKHTPGHTIGGTCYYIAEAGLLFSGDTLFAASVGRTDFPTGSMSQIVHSIQDKLMVLPDDTKVFPGHGESSSIGYEKKYNPFLQ